MPRPDELQSILKHWREAVPEDRLAHLIRDAARAQARALQMRLLGACGLLRPLELPAHPVGGGRPDPERVERAGRRDGADDLCGGDRDERLGLVWRKQLSGNRKNVHVYPTAKGRTLRRKLIPLAEEVNRISVGGISAADVATTRRVLLAMLDNLAGDDAEPANAELRVPSTRELSLLPARAAKRARKSAPA